MHHIKVADKKECSQHPDRKFPVCNPKPAEKANPHHTWANTAVSIGRSNCHEGMQLPHTYQESLGKM